MRIANEFVNTAKRDYKSNHSEIITKGATVYLIFNIFSVQVS
jgi:hypothetical protein